MKLPTFRGVSSVAFAQLDADPDLEILVGDGWHQNYGELAEPRLTLLDYDREAKTWKPTLLDTVAPQYSIDKIRVVQRDGPTIIAGGDRMLTAYAQANDWQRQVLYEQWHTTPWDFDVMGDRLVLAKEHTIAFLNV